MKWITVLLGLVVAAITTRAELNVVATLPDFGSIAETIGGRLVRVTTIARGSEDPHFVDARPSFIRVLNRADLLIEGGADLELGWLPSLAGAARNARIQGTGPGHLVLAGSIQLMDVPQAPVDRSMGDVHASGNPHFWLDPRNGKIIAEQIADSLAELDPKNEAAYRGHLGEFSARLDAKWPEWQAKMEPLRGAKVVTYHKSFEYFANAFGLKIVAQLEPKPGIEPTASHIAQLVRQSKEAGVKLIVIEPYRPRRSAEQLADAIGARLVIVPEKTGATPEAKSYISLFDSIISKLTEAFASPK